MIRSNLHIIIIVIHCDKTLPADIVNAGSFGIFVHKLNLHDLSGFCRGGRA